MLEEKKGIGEKLLDQGCFRNETFLLDKSNKVTMGGDVTYYISTRLY